MRDLDHYVNHNLDYINKNPLHKVFSHTIKTIVFNKCYWLIDEENEMGVKCSCDKTYFDVLVHGESVRLIVCKDWYVNRVRQILNNEHDVSNNDFHGHQYRTASIHTIDSAKERTLHEIIIKMFNGWLPIEYETRWSYQKGTRATPLNRNIGIRVCDKPLIYAYVSFSNLYKFISEYKNDIDYRYKEPFYYHLVEMIKYIGSKQTLISKCNKYSQWSRYDNYKLEDNLLTIMTEIFDDFVKLKIINQN